VWPEGRRYRDRADRGAVNVDEPVVVVGAGAAGGTVATSLRAEGFDGRIVLLGAEGTVPYRRPMLSKEYLRGVAGRDDVALHRPGTYDALGIEVRPDACAIDVDAGGRRVVLRSGESLSYRQLVLATGARPRMLEVPGAGLAGVEVLRSMADADRIVARADGKQRAVVVGLGFVGLEVAASLRECGVNVTAIEPMPAPCARTLGEVVGKYLIDLHREHAVRVMCGMTVEAIRGAGAVEEVVASDGTAVPCDLVVVGVGVDPCTDLAVRAGAEVTNGILVDEYCRSTATEVLAAGDVARAYHPVAGRHIRVEHWQNALAQGKTAARSCMGKWKAHDEIPWFWSDQYDANIQFVGFPGPYDREVCVGDPRHGRFGVLLFHEGVLAAAVGVNAADRIRRWRTLVRKRADVSAAMEGEGRW
jgi:3-phenylpropionate/trans-cinnamate dioxygenase ferredoxin reductase component